MLEDSSTGNALTVGDARDHKDDRPLLAAADADSNPNRLGGALTSTIIYLTTLLLAVLIPCLGIYATVLPYINEAIAQGRVVDRSTCTCSCWDGYFKGAFRPGPLNVYFNMTSDTLFMVCF